MQAEFDFDHSNIASPEHTTFEQWVGGREIAHYSTNSGAEPIAFQSWRNFKEAFAPELVRRAFEETSVALGRTVRSCIDPFGGSGTTALACQFLGAKSLSIEVNPYLADLIEAKLATYNTDNLIADFQRVLDRRGRASSKSPYADAPDTFVEPGVNGRFIFSLPVATRLAAISRKIERLCDPVNRRLLRVLLASIAVDCSNVVVSGKGRRYRRGWQKRPVYVDRVDELFTEAFLRAVFEMKRFEKRVTKEGDVIRGDARHLIPTKRRYDMAVFSPPYPNSFDYTDVYNVELWVCGYLRTKNDNRELRMSTLRSHVQLFRPYDCGELNSETLKEVYSDLLDIRSRLWNKHIPEMIRAYFDDMRQVIERISKSLQDEGRCYIVVGDSRYQSVQIPVAKILREIALSLPLEVVASEPFRSMRSSPQQGGRPELDETLITLRRVPRI